MGQVRVSVWARPRSDTITAVVTAGSASQVALMATAFAESPPVPARLRPDPPSSLMVSGCPAFTSNERGINYEGRIGVKVHSS